jgi:CheY-like chemotaxis protein
MSSARRATASRGLEAYKDGSVWDAVLLDQKMPGMDGLDAPRHQGAAGFEIVRPADEQVSPSA